MRTASIAGVALIMSLVPVTSARQSPNLTGTWVASDATPPAVQRAPVPTFGERFAVRQSADSIALLRPLRATTTLVTLPLTGAEVRTRVPSGLCLGEATTIETATRDGDALVLSVVGSISPGATDVMKREIRRVFRQPDNDTLIVETRMAVQGQLQPVATTYKRSTDTIAEPSAAAAPKAPASIAQASWIAGLWSGTEKTTTIEERWTAPSGGVMIGTARTMPNGAMSSFEFLCIAEKGGTLVYQAMPNGRSPATDFTASAVTADSITFENPAHDYPKTIRYTKKADGSLETTIAGEGGARARSSVLKRQE